VTGIRRGAVRQALLAVAADAATAAPALTGLAPEEVALVTRVGAAQGLGTTLVAVLRAAGLEVGEELEARRFDAAVRHERIMATLGRVAPALTDAGVPWVVLKGPVIADAFRPPARREFVDLDLLVAGPRLADGLEALRGAAAVTVNRNWEAYLEHAVAEFPVATADTTIDLHWHLIGLGTTRRRFTLPASEILERRRRALVGGVDAYRLDVEDHLLHVALHCGLGGANRLGALRDVHATVSSSPLDWDALVDRASRFGAGPIVGQVLDRSRRLLDTPVDPSVISRMAPPSGLVARALLDRLASDVSPEKLCSGFPVAVARRGVSNTTGCLLELVRDRVGVATGRAPRWSAHDPSSSLFWLRPTGGRDGLQRYLQMAAGGG
jgi:Uncharacterised nucleotidyltransferase